MNIFFLSWNIVMCARWHCDKHCVKMILEYAQLLSTAHRVLDGTEKIEMTKNNRKIKRWYLTGKRDSILYKSTHINHPSAIWARESSGNYVWLYRLFCELCDEYTRRYGKIHLTDKKMRKILENVPNGIHAGCITNPPQAMPDVYKENDPIEGYRNYYNGDKQSMLKWKNGIIPKWVVFN